MKQLVYGYYSNVGTYRHSNQDFGTFITNPFNQHLALICDGMGGHAHGEIASKMAVKLLSDRFMTTDFSAMSDNNIIKWFNNAVRYTKAEMTKFAMSHPRYTDMGTTLVGVIITATKLYVVNIGDSRLYHFIDNELVQVTTDQNLLNSQSARTKFEQSRSNLLHHKQNNDTFWKVLISALGPDKKLKIDNYIIDNLQGTFILTTDGIHDYVDEYDFRDAVLVNKKMEEKIKLLVKRAIDNYSTDNLTALMFQL